MSQFKLIILSLFAFLVAVFAVSNQESVNIYFFNRPIISNMSLVVIVLGTILIGVVLSALLGFLSQSKLKKKISILDKDNGALKAKEEKLQLKIRELEEKIEEYEPSEESYGQDNGKNK